MKKPLYTELAYVLGLIFLALGAALMAAADFGMSMVVAPAYILHLKLSETWSFFTFGMAEYTFQALLIIALTIAVRKFKWSYLFSFVTAVVYGFMLDGAMSLVALMPFAGVPARVCYYVFGMLLSSLGVALMFRTYISPEAYELFVLEVSRKFSVKIGKFKTGYDCASCLLGVVMSFAFFGMWHFEGVKLGTVFCALINGFLIDRISRVIDIFFTSRDAFPLRGYFSK